jgi:hypothetical protein
VRSGVDDGGRDSLARCGVVSSARPSLLRARCFPFASELPCFPLSGQAQQSAQVNSEPPGLVPLSAHPSILSYSCSCSLFHRSPRCCASARCFVVVAFGGCAVEAPFVRGSQFELRQKILGGAQIVVSPRR